MEVPDVWTFALLALAAWRTWKLVGDDRILDRPRALLLKHLGEDRATYWGDFLTCMYCAGFWISVGWWGAWQLSPHWTLVAAVPLAVSAVVGLLGTTLYALSED